MKPAPDIKTPDTVPVTVGPISVTCRPSVTRREEQSMSEQLPFIGRNVHYKSFGTPGGEYPPETRAAIITAVHADDVVDLAIFNPTGLFFNRNVPRGNGAGQWNWPPLVSAK